MKTIDYLHLTSAKDVSENIEVIPLEFKFLQNWHSLPSSAAMRLLSVALTMTILSVAKEALAVQKIGNNGAEVTNIQRCLKKLGYFNGPVTGKFATLTSRGVIAFQRANRLSPDGIVGGSTQRILQTQCQGRNTGGNPNPGGNTSSELRPGSSGQAVAQIQQDLRQLGYFKAPINGYFGPDTQQAVIRFQQTSRINADGIVGSRTKQAILVSLGQGNGEYPLLSQGSNGPAVTRLQQRLRQLGYFSPNPTGNFGSITRDAVIAFQRNAGIPIDGTANRQTWDALLRVGQVTPPNNGSTLPDLQVRDLQQRLRDLGYFNGNITGNFGSLTRDAVARFQRDYRLPGDGSVDAQTFNAIRSVWESKYANQPGTQPPRNFLTLGDRGDNVKIVQQRLVQLGFFNVNPDGYFSEYTKSSVAAFQQSNRLNASGVVDAQTWQALGLNSTPVVNQPNKNRYVVVVPVSNGNTLNTVRQYIPNAFAAPSRLGDYVNAGAYSDRSDAEKISQMLRSRGLDARVDYF